MEIVDNEIRLKLIWLDLCNDKQQDAQNYKLQKFKSFFMQEIFKAENSNYSIKFGLVKPCALAINCQESLFEVDCHLLSFKAGFQSDFIYSKICRQWCLTAKTDHSNGIFHWLQPINNRTFFQKKEQYHDDVQVNSLSFGIFIGMRHFIEHYVVEARHKPNISELSCSFWHDKKNLVLLIWIEHHSYCYINTPDFFRLVISYDDIIRVIIDDQPGNCFTELYLQLKHPPRISAAAYSLDHHCSETILNRKKAITMLKQKNELLHHWERVTEIGCECRKLHIKGNVLSKCPIIKINIADKVKAHNIIGRLYHRYQSENLYYSAMNSSRWKNIYIKCPFQTFRCKYAWFALLSKSFDVIDQIIFQQNEWEKLSHTLKCYENQDSIALEKALFEFFSCLDKGLMISFHRAIEELFYFYKSKSIDCDSIDGIRMIRRAFITPLRILFLPAQQHFDNRVLRHFNAEFALRISIRDDNLKKLTFCLERMINPDDFLQRTVGNPLTNGINIATRKYTFLAASPSQLRDHGIWMYATDDEGNTSEDIRKWLGDFTGIHNVAKLMSRMGQCFSTSEESIQVKVTDCEVSCIKDVEIPIKNGHGPYIFSDGVGMISSDLVKKINNQARIVKQCTKAQPYNPCAFQIRLEGCKGMLVENPTLGNRKIFVRKSMKKFECNTSHHLEIVKRSAPRAVYLNRPFIVILEQLGVPQNVFLNLQKNMILEFTDALLYEEKACNLLKKWMPIGFSFQKLYESGMIFTSEPFFNLLLNCIYKNNIAFLRSKTRISVPPDCGRNMFGVLDETGTLEYGEIFVQYSEDLADSESKLHIVEGTVVVTKCPCIHPGDVRKFHAINVEKLHHIKDCIVFPSKGDRPHPDEMAGSDLDGDEYIVIWRKDLIFPKPNQQPMHFPAKKKDNCLSRSIMVNDMINFVCNYIKNDNIGILANAHLTWADREKQGIFSKKCLSIAKKLPYSLDFAKTGETEHLSKNEIPDKYPDFMDKKSLNISYRSEQILGHLYRRSRSVESAINQHVYQDSLVKIDECFRYPGWEKYKESAEANKIMYESKLISLFQMFGIENEAELFCGNINVNKYNESKNHKDNIVALVQRNMEFLQARFRERFFQDLDESAENKSNIYQKASAWYMVTYDNPSVHFRSFPWCIAFVLAEMRENQKVPIQSSFLDKINIAIRSADNLDKFFSENCNLCKEQIIAVNVIWTWALKNVISSTFTLKEAYNHKECFKQIYTQYKSQDLNKCSVEKCGCSAGVHVLEFLKFCGNLHISSTCSHKMCFGGESSLFVWLALKLYTVLSVTRNPFYLGILSNTVSYLEEGNFESDPVMVPIDSEELENLVREKWDNVKCALKVLSGVKEINVRMAQNYGTRKSLLVSSVGTEWQCWQLEELIIRPNLFSLLQEQIDKASLSI